MPLIACVGRDLKHHRASTGCWLSEDRLANLSSKPSSRPPEGLQWGGSETGAARKPPEQAPQLKGVFGEGASVVAIPAASSSTQGASAPQLQASTPEQLQQSARRAQSRGLWTDGGNAEPAPGAQPKAEKLPKAVVGTTSLPPTGPANTNVLTPLIGSGDGLPLSTAETQSLPPLSKHEAQRQSGAPASEAQPAAVSGAPAANASEPGEPTTKSAAVPVVNQVQTPVVAAPDEAIEPARPSQPLGEPRVTGRAAPFAAPTPERSSLKTAVLLTLIAIAAVVALLFIGAALGLWGLPLPWTSGWTGHAPSANTYSTSPTKPEVAPPPAAPETAPESMEMAEAPGEPGSAEDRGLPEATEPAQTDEAQGEAADSVADGQNDQNDQTDQAPDTSDFEAEEAADPPSLDTAQALSAARAELRANDSAAAEALLKPLLAQNPDDHHVAEVMARALLSRGASAPAIRLARRIVRKRPRRASYRILLGDALRRAGDEAGARAAYRRALALDPQSAEAQRKLKR